MKISRVLFRTSICIMVLGFSIFVANFSSTRTSSTIFQSFEVPANGKYMAVNDLYNRPYEIRIMAPDEFKGVFCILDYEGIKRLTEGTMTPMLELVVEGSALIDFTPNRRGAYMFIIESKVSEIVRGSIGLIEKEAISKDIIVDSTIITLFGFGIILTSILYKHLQK